MIEPEPQTHREDWLTTYERRTSPVLSGLALVFLATYSAQSIWYEPGAAWYRALAWFGVALWALFAVDLLLRLSVSDRRLAFLKANWLDTITVAIPQLRALRTLRFFTRQGVLSKGKGSVSGGAVTTAALATLLLVWIGSLTVLNAERGASGADITTMADAVWWSFETITTVGYGDYVPVTFTGRFAAILMMFLGVSVLSIISATIAATLVKQGASPPSPAQEVMDELQDLKEMVASMQQHLGVGSSSAASVSTESVPTESGSGESGPADSPAHEPRPVGPPQSS